MYTHTSFGKVIFTLVYVLTYPLILFSLAGDWMWKEGWIFSIWFLIICFGTIIYLYLHDPALLSERYKIPGADNHVGWDRLVVIAIAIGYMTWFILMPLDAKRYAWSPLFPFWLEGIGVAILFASSYFLFRPFAENTFLSPNVRIQLERDHTVISTGVYGVVRHPMYFGAVLLFLGTPILLGSIVGIVAGILIDLLLAWRILGEENLLEDELAGDKDYKMKVRYRLIPWLW